MIQLRLLLKHQEMHTLPKRKKLRLRLIKKKKLPLMIKRLKNLLNKLNLTSLKIPRINQKKQMMLKKTKVELAKKLFYQRLKLKKLELWVEVLVLIFH